MVLENKWGFDLLVPVKAPPNADVCPYVQECRSQTDCGILIPRIIIGSKMDREADCHLHCDVCDIRFHEHVSTSFFLYL